MAGEEEIRITLRLPPGVHRALVEEADKNSRSLNGEIVSRLADSFTTEQVVKEAVSLSDTVVKEIRHQSKVLEWMQEQQSATIRILEHIAKSDGNLSPEFMEVLRTVLARRGGDDTGFPKHPDEED